MPPTTNFTAPSRLTRVMTAFTVAALVAGTIMLLIFLVGATILVWQQVIA